MTPTEDREIVEALAVNVMGWHSDRAPVAWWFDRAGRGICGVADWDPLTNAADSKALRDRLAELGWPIQTLDRLINGQYRFRVGKRQGERNCEMVGSQDAGEFRAVVLCALKAIGVEL